MLNQKLNSILVKIVFLLSIVFLSSSFVNAQMRARSSQDSVYARLTNTWFDPSNYQFENTYTKLSAIPPLSTDMPFDIMLAYVYLDSLLRDFNDYATMNRWAASWSKNDTINMMVKYLYKLQDFDPQRFNQYTHTTSGKYYKSNNNYMTGSINNLVDRIDRENINYRVMCDLMQADYIFRVQINSIDSLSWLIHPNQYVYSINATVTDTLKGRQFQNCCNSFLTKKQNKDKPLSFSNPCICFTYYTGPYSNENYQIYGSLLNSSGNLQLYPGEDLIVTLAFRNYKWDYEFDYSNLSLLRVLPVINGQVKDVNHEFSPSDSQSYSAWKNTFLQKVNLLLNGGY